MWRIILSAVGLFVAVNIVSALLWAEKPNRQTDPSMALFEEVLDKFQQYHHGEKYTRRQLVEAAIEGMLLKVDPDGMYFNEEDLSYYNQTVSIRRGYVGLGIRFERRLQVVTSWPNSSAYANSIIPGDRILEIDGKPVSRMSLPQAAHNLAGAPNSKVKVKIVPSFGHEPRVVELVRQP